MRKPIEIVGSFFVDESGCRMDAETLGVGDICCSCSRAITGRVYYDMDVEAQTIHLPELKKMYKEPENG